MIGTALHGFDAARIARQGMSQGRLSRQSPTGGKPPAISAGRAMTVLSENGAEWRSTAQFGPLRIEYVVTTDDLDGTPVLPGLITDDIFWGVVARLPGGRTRWRRIELFPRIIGREATP